MTCKRRLSGEKKNPLPSGLGHLERGEATGSKTMFSLSSVILCLGSAEWIPAFF